MSQEAHTPFQANYGNRVRITLPVAAAANMDKFLKVIRNLGDALGCPNCFSGADCTFSLIRDYVVDPATLNVKEAGFGR
jgi:hypothetical protein